MTSRECETCIKRKTVYCPTSIECMATDDKPYYQNRIMLLEENQELKKQLENKNPLGGIFAQVNDDMLLRSCGAMQSEIKEYKTQQKEFIKYLEDEIKHKSLNATCMFEYNDTVLPLKEILQKYKEIIGDDK